MKSLKTVLLTTLMVGAIASTGLAQTSTSLPVSATLPAATGSTTQVDSHDAVTDALVTSNVSALNFDPLTFDASNGIYLPDHYFAMYVAGTGGAGGVDINISYTEGAKPAGQVNGLGFKTSITFLKVVTAGTSQTETALASHPKKNLIDIVGGELIAKADTAGGFFKAYIGMNSGDANTPSGGEPFTNADLAGAYSGTITVTTTP